MVYNGIFRIMVIIDMFFLVPFKFNPLLLKQSHGIEPMNCETNAMYLNVIQIINLWIWAGTLTFSV